MNFFRIVNEIIGVFRILFRPMVDSEGANAKKSRGNRIDPMMARKEARMKSLTQQVQDLTEVNARLEEEQRQSKQIISELRVLVDTFQVKLDETRKSLKSPRINEELERYKMEVAVLTRALAVSSVDSCTDGDFAISQAQQSMEIEQLRNENERFRSMEAELLAVQLHARENEELRNTLVQERVKTDSLKHKVEALESFQSSIIEDRDRVKLRCDELEQTIGSLRTDNRNAARDLEQRLHSVSFQNTEYVQTITSLEISEKKQRQRVHELDRILAQRDMNEQASRSDSELLRKRVTELELKIRNLSASLTAEAEANEHLGNRLERIETEREKISKELVIARRREQDLRNDFDELLHCKSENEELRRTLFSLQHSVAEKESRILSLEHSREAIRESMSSEIDRLTDEVSHMTSTTASLTERYTQLERERNKIKSQLASETMAKLAPMLRSPLVSLNQSRYNN